MSIAVIGLRLKGPFVYQSCHPHTEEVAQHKFHANLSGKEDRNFLNLIKWIEALCSICGKENKRIDSKTTLIKIHS